jgi:hypothetical protein
MSPTCRATEPRPQPGRRLARIIRAAGYATVCALVLANARALRFRYAGWHGSSWLSGLWTGEVVFLVAMAACVAGVTAVAARRSPVWPAALAVGTVAGTAISLVLVALPPAGNPLHLPPTWLPAVHALGRGVGIPLVLAGGVVAGLMAARRTSGPGSARPLADVQVRQSMAAGLCAGVAAALLVSVVGAATVDAAHLVASFPPALPDAQQLPVSVLAFEMGLAGSAAGYLPVLVVLPLLGAGLGAWGGLLATNPAGHRPGGNGGGGGSGGPAPPPAPPGGECLGEDEDADVFRGQRELVLV